MDGDIFKDVGYVNGVAQTARVDSLSDDQEHALKEVRAFLSSSKKEDVIGGVAGSGKSSIIPFVADECMRIGCGVEVCAPTGKAAMVLRRKGITEAKTLHSFLYRVEIKKDKDGNEVAVFVKRPVADFYGVGLLIVDEASMVTRDMHDYILSLPFKTLYIGDHFQLPPVGDDFNMMSVPDFRMETILRQNEDNPIVSLADAVRKGGGLPLGKFGDSIHTRVFDETEAMNCNEMIVWTNKCKDAMNDMFRNKMGYPEGVPVLEDKMIVRVNNAKYRVFNGQIVYLCGQAPVLRKDGTWSVCFEDELAHDDVFVAACTNDYVKARATVHLPKEELEKIRMSNYIKYNKKSAAVHLDWGYAITCHAAQGSSWKHVTVIDESRLHSMRDWNRWMYTALTRAEESVSVYTGDFSKYFKK